MDLIGNVLLGFAVSGGSATTFYILWCYAAGEHGRRTSPGLASMLRLRLERVMSRWPAILLTSMSALLGFLLAVAVLPASNTDPATAQTCRRTVTTLLITHDAVDLERSRILIGELGCNVRSDVLAQGG